MSSTNKNIDFIIIWKKINSDLSEKEEKNFNEWLESDSSHKDFFDKIVFFYNTGKVKNASDLDVLKAWDTVEPRLGKPKKRMLPDWIKIVGSVAATVIIMFVIHSVVENQHENADKEEITEMIIPPGTSKARLIFDNGETVDLSQGKAFQADVEGTTISNKGNQISYTGQEDLTADLRFNTLEIPRGAEYFIVLSDSTKVWLNSDSRLKFPVNFIGDERVVELSGEAYFEVSKDTSRPFKVITAGQVVEVLGTTFNISTYTDDAMIYTTLVEGKVKVFAEDNPELPQYLMPGYQTYMFKETGDISIRQVDVDEYIAWKNGEFHFNNRSLADMMKTISRWYDINIVFEQDSKKDIRFSGTIKRYENLEQVLHLIEKTHEVKFVKSGNQIIIK